MRIALVSDCYLPRLGGIETQVAGLARALADAGNQVCVYTATSGEDADAPTTSGGRLKIRRLALPLPASLPYNPLAAGDLARELPHFDVVHVHCSTFSPLARAATNIAVRLKLPTVVTWHSVVSDMAALFKRFYPLAAWARAGVILTAVSVPAAAAIGDIAGLPIEVLPNSINAAPWDKIRQARGQVNTQPGGEGGGNSGPDGPGRGPLRVVTACRLVRRKRVLELLKVVENARQRGADIELTIFGDGMLMPVLQRRQRAGYAVNLVGRVEAAQLAQAYAGADLFASAVTKEAFGIAALEAHACGLPVIYRKGSGICDFITDGEDGLAARSDEHLTAMLVQLDNDRDLLAHLQRGAAAAEPVTWERAVDIVGDFYRKARAAASGR